MADRGISAVERPHVWEGDQESCWCRPEVEHYAAGPFVVHRALDVRPDREERLAIFSR